MHALNHYHELLFQSMKLILFLGCHVVKNELLADWVLKASHATALAMVL